VTRMDNPHIRDLDATLESFTDQRIFSRADVRTCYLFNCYLVDVLATLGVEYRGHTFRYNVPMCLLVVRGTIKDRPYVSFVSGMSALSCQRIFLRRCEDDEVEWREDQFG
jgi:hypothetical protein